MSTESPHLSALLSAAEEAKEEFSLKDAHSLPTKHSGNKRRFSVTEGMTDTSSLELLSQSADSEHVCSSSSCCASGFSSTFFLSLSDDFDFGFDQR
jgi:hypothetical protein